MCDNKNFNESQSTTINLEKRLTELEEYIYSKNNNLTLIDDTYKEISKKHTELEEKCHHIYSIKEHLFSTLALFFGIFTLISIDIGLTKSVFSSSEGLKNHNYSTWCLVVIVILQIIFCLSIYCFLVKPFLYNTARNKSNEKKSFLKRREAFIYGVVLIICTLIILFPLYKNSFVYKKINDLEKEITSLKSTISDLNKHKK